MRESPTSGPHDARRRPPERTDPSLLLLGGVSVLCAVFAIATTGALLIVATVAVGDSFS